VFSEHIGHRKDDFKGVYGRRLGKKNSWKNFQIFIRQEINFANLISNFLLELLL